MPIQVLKGTTSAREAITPLEAELLFDTTLGYLYVGDGSTVGGKRVGGEATQVHTYVYNDSGAQLDRGTPVFISGYDLGNELAEVDKANASSSATMPALGLMEDDTPNGAIGEVVVSGQLIDFDTSAFTAGDAIYIDTSAGALTATKPSYSAQIQKVGICVRSHVNYGVIEVVGAGRTNDVPALQYGAIFVGNSSGNSIQTTSPVIGDVRSRGNIFLNVDGVDGDSYLYFFDGSSPTGQHLLWDDSAGQFVFSTTVRVLGDVDATGNSVIGSNLISNNDIFLNYNGTDGDSHLYFYDQISATGESLMWDDSEDEFVLSSPLRVADVPGIPCGFSIIIDGGGAAISTGINHDIEIPYDMTITQWTIYSHTGTASIVVDLWQDTYANAPPTVADTITGANKPTLTAAAKNQTTGLSWALLAGSVVRINVDSVTNTQICTIGFIGTRT